MMKCRGSVSTVNQLKLINLIHLFLQTGVQVILLTHGKHAITCYTQTGQIHVMPPTCDAVDTTAAGDAFMGGFLYALHQQTLHHQSIDQAQLQEAVIFASQCGAFCVQQYGAFAALPNQDDLRRCAKNNMLI